MLPFEPYSYVTSRYSVDIWLPTQCICWSVVSGAQFWMKGRASFLGFRVAIAVFQGGFIPDAILYFSYYYTKHELPLRLALFWCINYASEVITGFLAAGILEMRGVQGQAGWQWYFLFLGLISCVASFFSLQVAVLKSGPQQPGDWCPVFLHPRSRTVSNQGQVATQRLLYGERSQDHRQQGPTR